MNIAKPEATRRIAINAAQKADEPNGAYLPRAFRVNDACRILSVSRSTIYAMAAKGEIRLVRLGGRTLVPLSEIARLLGEAA